MGPWFMAPRSHESTNRVHHQEQFIFSSGGAKLFTCRWLPKHEPKALVFLCHGYAMECSISMKDTATRLVEAGYGVYGMDYEGHGKSSGLQGYVPSFDGVVDDCAAYFTQICEEEDNVGRRRFLFGESMGGAVVLLLHRKKPNFWDGAVLVAPMCRISENMKPPAFIVSLLGTASRMLPTWKLVPTQDIVEIAFKTPQKRDEVRSNPYCYKGRPRLRTAHELLTVSMNLERNLHQVSLPFIVVHGGDDVVTDPSVSRLLHESAASRDKTFNLYPGMWHALTSGEPMKNVELVFHDIISWLDARAAFDRNAWLEMEAKCRHDGWPPS